jgi:hypothetical protein
LIGTGRRAIPQYDPKHFLMEVFYRTFPSGLRPSAEHLKFIRNEIEVIDGNGDVGKLRWLGERLVQVPVYVEMSETPSRPTTTGAWIIDYELGDAHRRELHFFQQAGLYGSPAKDSG